MAASRRSMAAALLEGRTDPWPVAVMPGSLYGVSGGPAQYPFVPTKPRTKGAKPGRNAGSVLTLRSARAAAVPQKRNMRARVSKVEDAAPSCFETPRSAANRTAADATDLRCAAPQSLTRKGIHCFK